MFPEMMKLPLVLVVAITVVVIGTEGKIHIHKLKNDVKKVEAVAASFTAKKVTNNELKNVVKTFEAVAASITNNRLIDIADGCECIDNNCGCCGRMVVKKVEFDETVCVNVSYLPKEYGARVTITLNDLTLLNQTISAKNPPPLCAGVPRVKELSLCIRFYNLSVGNLSFAGCIDIEAHVLHIIEEKYDLGCFKIGNGPRLNAVNYWKKLNQQGRGFVIKSNRTDFGDAKIRSSIRIRQKRT